MLADIRAVVNELEMVRPIVVGHSLGGMLAAMYADRYGDAAGAVNLDGHSDRLTEDLLDPDIAARLSTLLRSIADGVVQEMSRPRSAEEIGVARARWVAGAQALGLDAALAVEAFDRRLIDAGNGMSTLRPEAKQLHELRSAVEHLDLLELYRRTAAPQLVYVATRDQEEATAPEELRQLTAAYRRALIHGLRAIAQTRRSVQLIELDATHGLIYECPQLIAGQIRQFTSSLSGSPAPVGAASQEHG